MVQCSGVVTKTVWITRGGGEGGGEWGGEWVVCLSYC